MREGEKHEKLNATKKQTKKKVVKNHTAQLSILLLLSDYLQHHFFILLR